MDIGFIIISCVFGVPFSIFIICCFVQRYKSNQKIKYMLVNNDIDTEYAAYSDSAV